MKVLVEFEVTAGMNGPDRHDVGINGKSIGYLVAVKTVNGEVVGWQFFTNRNENSGNLFANVAEFRTWVEKVVTVTVTTPIFEFNPKFTVIE